MDALLKCLSNRNDQKKGPLDRLYSTYVVLYGVHDKSEYKIERV